MLLRAPIWGANRFRLKAERINTPIIDSLKLRVCNIISLNFKGLSCLQGHLFGGAGSSQLTADRKEGKPLRVCKQRMLKNKGLSGVQTGF